MRQPTAEEWLLISQQFDRLCDLEPTHQRARLAQARLTSFVIHEVERLLKASRKSGILDAEFPQPSRQPPPAEPLLPTGTMIDQFCVDRAIGQGGAGDVYLATRIKNGFSQHVALKLLRSDAVTNSNAFDAERALVATLAHPGIARLVDGGTGPGGRPYMALDYIDGKSITDWCLANRAGLEKRLELLLEVCDAVAYAHARLIVHHDIKPANILIDTLGRAKLLDFGIAKVIEEDAQGRQDSVIRAILTPGYAAPEQLAGARPTIAADIYALGALMFELLVGVTAWKPSRDLIPMILRRMGDDLPTAPSRMEISADHPINAKQLRGDLDAIVVQAMQDKPSDRYATVNALAEDVRRYMRNDPIAARSASARYRGWRFLQRNRWPIAVSTIAGIALIGGSGAIAWQGHRTAIERDVARDQAVRMEAANQAILMMFRDAGDDARLSDVTLGEMVDGATRRMIESLPADSPEAAPMIAALADIYLITDNNEDAQKLLLGALSRGIGRNDQVNWARLLLKLGTVLAVQGKTIQATKLLDVADRTWTSDPARFKRESVETIGARAVVARSEHKPLEAIRLLSENMSDAQSVYNADDRDYSARAASLAMALADVGKLAEAQVTLRQARATMAKLGQPPSSGSLNLARLQAEMFVRAGHAASAVSALMEVVAERRRYYGPSIALAVDLLHLARALNRIGQPARALVPLDEAEPMAAEHFGPLSQPVLQIHIAKVDIYAQLKQFSRARAVLALIDPQASALTTPGVNAIRFARAKGILAGMSGDPIEARRQLSRAMGMVDLLGRTAGSARADVIAAQRLLNFEHQ